MRNGGHALHNICGTSTCPSTHKLQYAHQPASFLDHLVEGSVLNLNLPLEKPMMDAFETFQGPRCVERPLAPIPMSNGGSTLQHTQPGAHNGKENMDCRTTQSSVGKLPNVQPRYHTEVRSKLQTFILVCIAIALCPAKEEAYIHPPHTSSC